MTKAAHPTVRVDENKWLVEGEKRAKGLLATLTKPAYMSQRLDLGIDCWEVGYLEHNYEA